MHFVCDFTVLRLTLFSLKLMVFIPHETRALELDIALDFMVVYFRVYTAAIELDL